MKTIWTLSLLIAFVFCALCGYVIWDTRRDVVEQAYRTNANLVQAISQDISRTFEMYDLSIQGAIEAMAQPDISQVSPTIRRMALFDNATKATYINRTAVLDVDGNVVEDSLPSPATEVNFSDREYFTAQRDNPDLGLYISKPFESRLTRGQWLIALSRRISGPQDSFRGVVVATLDINYFASLFSNLDAGPLDAFAILRSDGTMIIRHPFRLSDIGRDVRQSELFQYFPKARSGDYDGEAVSDGVSRIYSFGQVANLPLLVSVASAKSTIFETWLHKALLIGMLMAGLGIAMAALAICLVRELRQRRITEKKLEDAAAALTVAASTDGLTGLANRRRFDETAEIEWKCANRSGKPLSIFVMDVDFFKSYNDTFGHIQGDDALKIIASCIRATLARPSDFAARYGGEEFALLLPDTPKRSAIQLAENLCAAIAKRDIFHPRGLNNRISVSIGIATCSPRDGDSFLDTFLAADDALYRAKNLGRSKVMHADETSVPFAADISRISIGAV